MAENKSMTTAEVVAKTLIDEHADFLRDAVAMVARELMEAEIAGEIGAARGEVSAERTTHRNGYRPRAWETRVGEIELAATTEDGRLVCRQEGVTTGRGSGVETTIRYAGVYRFSEDGRLIEIREYASTPEALEAAGLSE